MNDKIKKMMKRNLKFIEICMMEISFNPDDEVYFYGDEFNVFFDIVVEYVSRSFIHLKYEPIYGEIDTPEFNIVEGYISNILETYYLEFLKERFSEIEKYD